MSAAAAPATEPVVLVCPAKTYADGRELHIFDDRVEIVFYANLRGAHGLTMRKAVATVVLTREVYRQLLCEVAPAAMQALMNSPLLGAVSIH